MRPVQLLAACAAVLMSFAQSMAQATTRDAVPAGPTIPAAPTPQPAQEPPASTDSATAALTKTDVDAWLDGFMPYALDQGDVAGAVVVVVKDGQILTQKGF